MGRQIRKADVPELNSVAELYDMANEFLEAGKNYPGWRKGVYPVRETAESALREESLFLALESDGTVCGSFILNHTPESGYEKASWRYGEGYDDILVLRTFVVHPAFLGRGIGREMLRYADRYAKAAGMKAIRLDVFEHNLPAIRLYENAGYTYVDTVDLGYSNYGLDRFRLYEKDLRI